jgi:hypothetical protein
MIGILTENGPLKKALLNKNCSEMNMNTNFPNLSGLFIDWIGNSNNKKLLAFQSMLITNYSKKKIPIAIYDRYVCMSNKEYEWLKKFNVFLFEPVLTHRKHFEYLPYYIDTDDKRILEENHKRTIDVGFSGSKDSAAFDKYYMEYMRKYGDRNVQYNSNIEWRNVRYTIAIDSDKNYNIGYMNISDALSNGCMVLCPEENKYYVGMFYPYYIVSNVTSIELSVNMNDELRKASILSLYKRIREGFPEFTLEYTVNRIMRVF